MAAVVDVQGHLVQLGLRHEQAGGTGRYELAGHAVWRDGFSGRHRDLFVGGQMAFGLMVSYVSVQTEQEIVAPPEGPKSEEVVGQRPIVEPIHEPRHSTELAAE